MPKFGLNLRFQNFNWIFNSQDQQKDKKAFFFVFYFVIKHQYFFIFVFEFCVKKTLKSYRWAKMNLQNENILIVVSWLLCLVPMRLCDASLASSLTTSDSMSSSSSGHIFRRLNQGESHIFIYLLWRFCSSDNLQMKNEPFKFV